MISLISFQDKTSNVIFLIAEKAITKSCKPSVTSKFMFEVITTKLSHELNQRFWQVVATSYGI